MIPQPATVAFFDVDETLITVKSMFRFLEFHLRDCGQPSEKYHSIAGMLREMAAAGVPREETNRIYYRSYAGQQVSDVARQGVEWFQAELAAGGLFRPEAVDELRRHRDAGDVVVLVSGSFPPCLDPIARHLGVTWIECTRPTIVDGVYTGMVDEPVIGRAKGEAVRRVAAEVGADLQRCTAYGDHASDLPMLRAVGRPVVVGDDPDMVERAVVEGWRRLLPRPVTDDAVPAGK